MKHLLSFPARWLVAMALAGLLTACGGGGDTSPGGPSTPTSPTPAGALAMTALRIAGDSLSDSGTFQGQPGYGRIFSVQGSSSEPHTLWVERLAVASGLATPCPVYRYDGTAFARNAVSGCRNFAVGGARVHNPSARGGDGVPLSIVRQLQDAAGLGLYAEGELVSGFEGAILRSASGGKSDQRGSNDGGAGLGELAKARKHDDDSCFDLSLGFRGWLFVLQPLKRPKAGHVPAGLAHRQKLPRQLISRR